MIGLRLSQGPTLDPKNLKRQRVAVWLWGRNDTDRPWKKINPTAGPFDSWQEASEAQSRAMRKYEGQGDSRVYQAMLRNFYIGESSPVDRWGRYKTESLARRYSEPGAPDYTWIPGRDPARRRKVKPSRDTRERVHVTPPPSDITRFALRIARGDRLTSRADLQFYANHAEAIERELRGMIGSRSGARKGWKQRDRSFYPTGSPEHAHAVGRVAASMEGLGYKVVPARDPGRLTARASRRRSRRR